MTEQSSAPVSLGGAKFYDTGVLEVRHPISKALTGWKVTFAGPGHPKTIAENDRELDKFLQSSKAQEMARVNSRKWKGDDVSVADARLDYARKIAARILDWTPVDFEDGKGAIAFSEAAAITILLDPQRSWIGPQFRDYLDDEKAFTTDSANS